MSEWVLTREPALGEAVFGLLTLGQPASVVQTLERESLKIPEGRYRVILTESNRAKKGELWCPDNTMRLPEIQNVPLRTGIRIHAGNKPTDSVGCILVAAKRVGLQLQDSRPTLTKVYTQLVQHEQDKDDVWLTVSTIHAPRWSQITTKQETT